MTDIQQDPPTDEVPAVPADAGGDDGTLGPRPRGPQHRRRNRRRSWLMVLAGLLALVVIVASVGYISLRHEIHPGHAGSDVQLTLPLGSSTSRIAQILQDKGVIGNATAFSIYVRIKGRSNFQAGDYTLRKHESYDKLISVLSKGPEVTVHKITIPEGFTLAQIAERVGRIPGRDSQRFLQVAQSGQVRPDILPAGSNNLEGLLFPDTYLLDKKDDETAILDKMVQGMQQVLAGVDVQGAAARLGITPYQVVIVASMVEREAKVDEDRGPIASVIYNRLKRGMPLGIDATLLYALNGDVKALNRDPHVASPYNTRDTKGLPPTPIASPGLPSLQAAANPPSTPFLFYVLADANGKHAFATTSGEFDRLVAQARAKGLL